MAFASEFRGLFNTELTGKDISICMNSMHDIQNAHPPSALNMTLDAGKTYSQAGLLYFELDAHGIIIAMNAVAEEKLAYEECDLIGEAFSALSKDAHQYQLKLIVNRCLKRGLIQSEKAVLYGQEGEIIHVLMNGIVHNDQSGNTSLIQFFAQDVTEMILASKLNQLGMDLMPLCPLSIKSIPHYLEKMRHALSLTYIGFAWPEHGRIHVLDTVDSAGHAQPACLSWPPGQWQKLANLLSSRPDGKGGWTNTLNKALIEGEDRGLLEIESLFYDIHFAGVWPVQLAHKQTGFLYALCRRPIGFNEQVYNYIQSLADQLKVTTMNISAKTRDASVNSKALADHQLLGTLVLRDGIVAQANPWICTFLGIRETALAGRRFIDLVPQVDHERINAVLGVGFNEAQPSGRLQFSLIDAHQREKGVEAHFEQGEIDEKPVQMWYFVSRETEFKLKSQLRRARKLEATGLLAGGLVHDFNNLMASVLGYSSLLNEEIDENSPYWKDISQIYKTAEKASERIVRLMAYSEEKQYVVRELDLNQLVKEVAGVLSRTSSSRISIRADLEPQISPFTADASEIQQLVLQLALNARDAMPEGGKLFFKTQNIEVGARGLLKKQGARQGQYVQLSISDTGCGIAPKHKERLFDDDFSTKDRERGQGAGLYFVKEIIDRHNGFISVFSEPGNGTMIKVHFPVKAESNTDFVLDDSDTPLLGTETVLLVDEQPVLRDTASKMLKRYGYQVVGAKSSNEAVGALKKYLAQIDIIILDMHMSGPLIQRVIHRFHQLKPQVKILAVTDRGEDLNAYQTSTAKLAGRIEKPYQVRPLMHAIRSALKA